MVKPLPAKTVPPAVPPRPANRTRLAGLLLVAATIAAYSNTPRYPFVFDDRIDIVDNYAIRQIWPPWHPLLVVSSGKTVLHARPVMSFSLAVNYAMGGLNTLPYHLTNLAIHVLAGLMLFGIARRTLASPLLAPRYAELAMPTALAIAAIWTLHPLQTQAVTYTVQRYESLMGMFYLLSLYCVIRSEASPRRHWWEAASVLACFLALECKEVAVSIPLVILLYDRTFLAGSFGEAWRRRRGLYLGLAATWLAFLGLFLVAESRAKWAGYGLPVSAWEYALSQFGVILHYLRLSFWPYPQVLDYDWPVARTPWEIVPGMVVIGLLLAATVWALVRRPAWGLLGAWFFLILAPTSSILPIADMAFEHRMYLPLAAVVAATVIAAYEAIRWYCARCSLGPGATLWALSVPALAAAAALCLASHARNAVYRDEVTLWRDVVAKAPLNARAHNNLGAALGDRGEIEESLAECRAALQLLPEYAAAHDNVGKALERLGKKDEALSHYLEALRIVADKDSPENVAAHGNLANLLCTTGKLDEAMPHLEKVVELDPRSPAAHYNLANALNQQGKYEQAVACYEKSLALDPQHVTAHTNLGNALYQLRRLDEAASHYRKALALNPQQMEAHYGLANALIEQGKLDDALAHCRQAVALKPTSADAFFMLGRAFSLRGDHAEAVAAWREALRLRPNWTAMLRELAWLLATCPDGSVRRGPQAMQLAQRAIQLSGESPELLDALAAAQAECGLFADAGATAQKALQLATARGKAPLAEALRARIKLYQAGKAYRTPGGRPQ